MSFLRRGVFVLLIFTALVVIISLFLPSSFHMDRKIVVNADKEQVFKQVNDLKNWKNWSVWALEDPAIYNSSESFSNPSFGEGATFFWNSENDKIGKGNLKINISTTDEYIENSLYFGLGEMTGTWNFNDVENGVEVVWGLDAEFGFNPFSKFFGLFMEGKISPDYELGLERLKTFTEDLPKIKKVVVKQEKIENDLWFLSIRDTINQYEINNVHGKIYETISQHLSDLEIENDEPPIVIYYSFSDTLCDIELGIPVKDSTIIGNGNIMMNKIKSTWVVTAVHHGAYDRLPETYFGINEWMRKNKVVVNGPLWETYLVNPSLEPDPDKWEVAIYFPIEKPNN